MICSLDTSAQKFTISGYISDSLSSEKMIGASILIPSLNIGTTANTYGFYSITLPSSKSVEIKFSYIGYAPKAFEVMLDKDLQFDVSLVKSNTLKGVVITSKNTTSIQEKTQMSQIDVSIERIKSIPALLGETDVLKALQLLPGVQSGGEGSDGIYVRGGGPDQNLILLDGTPVYNASHLFGFFSVFNADAIKYVTLTTGGFPARYGGRLSSVIDIQMKEGNMKKFHCEGTVGIIASKFTVEGPIKKDKASFIISARRTYIDVLAQPFIAAASGGEGTGGYYFYDLNAKLNYKVDAKNHLYLSFYSGDDKFYAKGDESYTYNSIKYNTKNKYKLGWGNITGAARWNHQWNKKLFSNTTLTYSKYRFQIFQSYKETAKDLIKNTTTTQSSFLGYDSGIKDYAAKIDFDFIPSPHHYIKYGISYTYHQFNTGAVQYEDQNEDFSIDTTINSEPVGASEFSIYIEDDWQIGELLKANFGIHSSGFLVNDKFYPSIQPRASIRYLLNEKSSLKASYAAMQQNIHLLTNSNIGLPTDLWVPATENIKPQQSWIAALGYAHTFEKKDQKYEFSIEAYYKEMNNIIDYLGGANFLATSENWESKVEAGKGWSYGAEFFLQKKTGKVSGWLGYTLSWTNRKFPTINFGNTYPYKYDRRHDIELVFSYDINDHVDLGFTWVYGTGNAITLPVAQYNSAPENDFYGNYSNTLYYYGDKNSTRMQAFHRADIGINFHKQKKKHTRTWSYGVYNFYNRKNPYFYYIGYPPNGFNEQRRVRKISLFPFIPSISYSFKF